ncbi:MULTISPECIES: CDP-glycerol glycerophosphotransferase family protein [Citrobacter]|nr:MULTISPECIES: CDP-glycerol glycerophosphotransferase family protein [Citrobacter]MDM2965078.1 CDP-glycerol glycerophosphotransferase family protein [Citrobacter sp. CK201]MDM3017073.1 CDP-glycerol glycerophosphotransferase family protein [Citrobacter sp. CK189]MDM3037447.1 CDP-glycerol glycerophosphotransferase family protein [Citrobacter sp. CK181]MDM3049796.1 CDP-glycerol glycerophosphotransferase family protein [Citrobacter sp. CK183]MDM3125590.1 CDP-glycerol glycerophosphotransferase fa
MNSKKIIFMSYSGLQYSCNPKYISDYIKDNYKDYELIWVFQEPEKHLLDPKFKKVKYLSLRYFYAVVTSQFCISNTGFNRFFFIRKSQRFVQTWHGGGAYKRRSLNQDKNCFQKLLDIQHDDMITDFISSSEYFTKYFIMDSVYKNRILKTGMPRNEFLIRNKNNGNFINLKRKNIEGVGEGNFLILYAPTWRDDGSIYEFPDFNKIMNTIERVFNKKTTLLLRSHHYQELKSSLDCNYIDVRNYPDMQELLLISDMLISDYSSSIWDFSLLEKPCFLYTPDLKYYEDMRGFYTPIRTWGFDVCQTSEELDDAIKRFVPIVYCEKIYKMHKQFNSYENIDSTSQLLSKLGIN